MKALWRDVSGVQKDMIGLCLHCVLPECIAHSVKCPFNQKFGKDARAQVMRQDKCGRKEIWDAF